MKGQGYALPPANVSVAPYISQQKKSLAEAPALEEFEVKLPSTAIGSGATVRIPPELMPSEEQCTEWFEIFFNNIHPYIPVISKPYFDRQWRTNRTSISPLILEAIFACAGRMSDDPAQGAQWLALASSRHRSRVFDAHMANRWVQSTKIVSWMFLGSAPFKRYCCFSRLANPHQNGATIIDLG